MIQQRPLDRIFISYSHTDVAFVDDLSTILDELDVPYFLDRKDITWGANIDASVSDALRSCSHIAVVISPGSEKSPWVPYELGQARGMGIEILPILTHPSMELPLYLAGNRHVDGLAAVRQELEKMVRRSVPIKVSLSVCHTQPATFEPEEGLEDLWGFNEYENPADVEPGLWLPSTLIRADSEASYPITIDVAYIDFDPPLRLADDSYPEMGIKGEKLLSPRGSIDTHFPQGLVANAITRAICNGDVKAYGIETNDTLRVEGSLMDVTRAAEYIRKFFNDVDLDAVFAEIDDSRRSAKPPKRVEKERTGRRWYRSRS